MIGLMSVGIDVLAEQFYGQKGVSFGIFVGGVAAPMGILLASGYEAVIFIPLFIKKIFASTLKSIISQISCPQEYNRLISTQGIR